MKQLVGYILRSPTGDGPLEKDAEVVIEQQKLHIEAARISFSAEGAHAPPTYLESTVALAHPLRRACSRGAGPATASAARGGSVLATPPIAACSGLQEAGHRHAVRLELELHGGVGA